MNENQLKDELPLNESLSKSYIICFQILLIILMIILFIMFVFFGLNHLILFVVGLTLTIRMFLGLHNRKSSYFHKSLFLFNWCFIAHVIKIIFRFILTYFVYNNREDISSLKDMNIIETENILWIKGFDIKINGIWTIIILIIFMAFWFILIILFETKKRDFIFVDHEEKERYLKLIRLYYQNHQPNNQNLQVLLPDNNNNNNNVNNK